MVGTLSHRKQSTRLGRLVILLGVLVVCSSPVPAQNNGTSLNDLGRLAWSTDSTGPRRFVSVHGRRAAIFGYSQPTGGSSEGLEVWAYPLQLVRSYRIAFRPQDTTTIIDGESVLRRIIYTPSAITRIYAGPDFVVREKLFVPLDERGVIIEYEVESARPLDIDVHFIPVLDLMWPASIGGQETAWSSKASGYVLSELTHRFGGIIESPEIVAHDETPNVGQYVGREAGVGFTIRPEKADHSARVIIAAADQGKDAGEVASRLGQNEAALEKASIAHYTELMSDVLRIETPEADINRALDWSEIAVDQSWVCNPDLGCGIVAGYGPSRKARRPQYDWFFAGDGMVAIQALLASGQYERARQELDFILKFQDRKTGMIWHEMSQSAALLDWDKYPYKFVHVDLTFDFLNSVASYLSITADTDFVKSNWHPIQSAFEYCTGLIDSRDSLPRIPNGKEGGWEQDALSDELALSVSWAEAAHSFATLARANGLTQATEKAEMQSAQARRAIVQRYWDDQSHAWISAYTRSGKPVAGKGLGSVRVNDTPLLPEEKLESLLDHVVSADFQTDWGTRSTAASAENYDPDSYSRGSVWATHTARTARELWSGHRPASAWPVWGALVNWSSLDSLGHMHEVLAGNYYHEEVESVPEQTWSSAEFLTSAVRGLLGIEVDGALNRLAIAPHLPVNWASVSIRNLWAGKSRISAKIVQSPGEVRLEMQNDGAPVEIVFDPEIPLGAKVQDARLDGRATPVTAEHHTQDEHARADVTLAHGSSTLVIRFTGGISIVADRPQPMVGESSNVLKITGVHLDGDAYKVAFDYFPREESGFEVGTPWVIKDARGGRIVKASPSLYRVTIENAPAQSKEITPLHGQVVLNLDRGKSD